MKILDKIGLALFSTLMLIIAVITCFLIFGWIDFNWACQMIQNAIQSQTISNILLGMNLVFILLAIKCIFFESKEKWNITRKFRWKTFNYKRYFGKFSKECCFRF